MAHAGGRAFERPPAPPRGCRPRPRSAPTSGAAPRAPGARAPRHARPRPAPPSSCSSPAASFGPKGGCIRPGAPVLLACIVCSSSLLHRLRSDRRRSHPLAQTHGEACVGDARQGKKARQGKARQGKARQGGRPLPLRRRGVFPRGSAQAPVRALSPPLPAAPASPWVPAPALPPPAPPPPAPRTGIVGTASTARRHSTLAPSRA